MKTVIPRETKPRETRAPMVPEAVGQLVKLGLDITVETAIGESLSIPDEAYRDAGATVADKPGNTLTDANLILHLNPPDDDILDTLQKGQILIGCLEPFRQPERIQRLARRGVSAICMELIPRTTLAQKMDALSSQASLAGYAAVILAAERIHKAFPMMNTPAGTIKPARVFIIGAGVAGLQAIATARRLGARVEAFDTRAVVEEQVQSLGARFVKIDLGETGQTKDGYATALTPEQVERQRQGMARHCREADIVITTAQVFGRPAPRILTADMIRGMRPGSVIVDMAVETGGNVEGSVLNEEVSVDGIRIIGLGNLPGQVALDASRMYASNLTNLIAHFWDRELNRFQLDTTDPIMDGALLTHEGTIRNELVRNKTEEKSS